MQGTGTMPGMFVTGWFLECGESMEETSELPEIPKTRDKPEQDGGRHCDAAVFGLSFLPEDERICYDLNAVHFIDPGIQQWGAAHPADEYLIENETFEKIRISVATTKRGGNA